MCFKTSDGKVIHNRVSDFLPHQHHDLKPGRSHNKPSHRKALKVFIDNKPILGHLLERDPETHQCLFQLAGSKEEIHIAGELPACKPSPEELKAAIEAAK